MTPSLRGAIKSCCLCDRRSPLCLAGQLARKEETAERSVTVALRHSTLISQYLKDSAVFHYCLVITVEEVRLHQCNMQI